MTTTQRWWALGMLALTAGVAGLNALAFTHADAMLRFAEHGARTASPEALDAWGRLAVLATGVTIPRPVSPLPPTALAPDCRDLSVPAPGGITLASWYCGRGRHTPLVLLFHGYAAEKTAVLAEARAFLALGTSVLLVDFRGSGGRRNPIRPSASTKPRTSPPPSPMRVPPCPMTGCSCSAAAWAPRPSCGPSTHTASKRTV